MGLKQMADPAPPPGGHEDPGILALMRVMEIQDLFDSADEPDRLYIAWRMLQTAHDLIYAARRPRLVPEGQEPVGPRAAA
jgi:hypothetical protein